MELRAARDADRPAIAALLRACELPVDDLDEAGVDFVVAMEGGALQGVGGLERHGDVALLRSLAVVPGRRGSGLGSRLARALEAQAEANGIRQLVLLTTTAAPFFARRGYATIARDAAPAAARRSAEFRALCPASATCLSKTIGEAA